MDLERELELLGIRFHESVNVVGGFFVGLASDVEETVEAGLQRSGRGGPAKRQMSKIRNFANFF